MVIKYDELQFDHIVDFTQDATVFAAARENGKGHIRLFLIKGGAVYVRNGRIDSWEELFGTDRDSVIARLIAAPNRDIPVYRINGTNGSI